MRMESLFHGPSGGVWVGEWWAVKISRDERQRMGIDFSRSRLVRFTGLYFERLPASSPRSKCVAANLRT